MKKNEELIRDITAMIKDTRAGKLHWDVRCQTTEFNDPKDKPTIEDEDGVWVADECYVSYHCEFKGKEFLMISYEMIHTCGDKVKSTNMIFLPPLGIRYFDIRTLLPHSLKVDKMLSYEVHMLWLTILEMKASMPDLIDLDADERKLTIEDE